MMTEDNFWNDIKPHIELLSHVKQTNSLPSNTGHDKIVELAKIHSKYISNINCTSCKPFKIVYGLINYYEKTKRKGRKKKL